MYPTDVKYCDESIRLFQGCPTLAITRGGRIFLGWYSGGTREPHIDNFNLLICSDDGGKTWSRPVLVIPGSRERCVQALDIQLWTAPDGKLWVFWVQNETCRADAPGEKPYSYEVDGYLFGDKIHAEWCMVCDDPDAEVLRFSEPRYLDIGFLRCKPLVLSDGTWINFNYDQTNSRYGYSISRDGGATTPVITVPKRSKRPLTRPWPMSVLTEAFGCLRGALWASLPKVCPTTAV